jgi:hypothetical protein
MVEVHAEARGEDWLCDVTVDQSGRRTRHAVTVRRADLERWADGSARDDVESLVAKSFEFLLEREAPSAILGTFELSVIQRYFADYNRTIRRR